MDDDPEGFDTRAVHAGESPDPHTGALDPPIVLSSAFAFASANDAAGRFDGSREGPIYSRWRNPTVDALEQKIAALEEAPSAVALASGMAAISAAFAALVQAGDHVIAPRSVYAETARLLRGTLANFGVRTTFVDATDPRAIEAAVEARTRVIYVETPANPALQITDLAAVAAIARAAQAVSVVDSTFATPYHQRPLAHGIDLVLHSATKALAGHGDVVGGVVAGAAGLIASIRAAGVRTLGGALSPLSAMLIARGIRTLGLRMERASSSAMLLARRLAEDPRVASVSYPGLPSHPGHAIAAKQMDRGFGALVAFEVEGGLASGARCYDAVRVISRAVSLGDVRTLLTHPASTTHHSMTPEMRTAAGIGEGLLRMSVGIEDVDDLWRDLDRALG